MFESYFLEEYGRDTLRNDHGFCMYVLNKEHAELFITDFYVKPESRVSYEGKKLFERVKDIGRVHNCEVVTALVSFGVKDPARCTRILRTYLSMGFQVMDSKNNQIILKMDISDEG